MTLSKRNSMIKLLAESGFSAQEITDLIAKPLTVRTIQKTIKRKGLR